MLSPRLHRTRWRCPLSSFVGPGRLEQRELRGDGESTTACQSALMHGEPLLEKNDNRVQVASRDYSDSKVISFPGDHASPTKWSQG